MAAGDLGSGRVVLGWEGDALTSLPFAWPFAFPCEVSGAHGSRRVKRSKVAEGSFDVISVAG